MLIIIFFIQIIFSMFAIAISLMTKIFKIRPTFTKPNSLNRLSGIAFVLSGFFIEHNRRGYILYILLGVCAFKS